MNWKVIHTEADELALLLVLVKDYEDKHIHLPALDPIETIKAENGRTGMKAKDLEPMSGGAFFNLPAEVFMQA